MIIRIIRKLKKYFFAKKNIKVGQNTRILTKLSNFGSEPFLVEIGNNCTITPGVNFVTHDASVDIALRYMNKDRIVNGEKYEMMAKIKVHDNCLIGLNSIVLPGVSIGPNSIVGAGSVVTADVPEGVIVAGNPAKVICTLEEYISKSEKKMVLIPIENNLENRKKAIISNIK
ncbi:DapH/DapD/GlmU-related protein [Neobacillus sp. D3-1R]|uniref:DapH/DapD/GlmU-related protein n=1 Tax=Neobacillus sp. D3-1R TaxID=3445778 RepID=UPI003F9EF8B4